MDEESQTQGGLFLLKRLIFKQKSSFIAKKTTRKLSKCNDGTKV